MPRTRSKKRPLNVEVENESISNSVPLRQESDAPRKLASLLGTRPRGDLPSSFQTGLYYSPLPALRSLGWGDLDAQLASLSGKLTAVASRAGRSLDRAVKLVVSQGGRLPPSVVCCILGHIEGLSQEQQLDDSLLEALGRLMRTGHVSDWAHPLLVERLVERNLVSLLLDFCLHVKDIRESSLVRIISHCLSSTEFGDILDLQSPSNAKDMLSLSTITPTMKLLITTMSVPMGRSALKAAMHTTLTRDQMERLLSFLQVIYSTIYARTHADPPTILADRNSWSLPRRSNILGWIEALLDVQYPSILHQPTAVSSLESINSVIKNECLLVEELLAIKAPISTLIYFARNRKARRERLPSRHVYSDYTLELVSF